VRPDAEDAAVGEPVAGQREELAGEQVGDAGIQGFDGSETIRS